MEEFMWKRFIPIKGYSDLTSVTVIHGHHCYRGTRRKSVPQKEGFGAEEERKPQAVLKENRDLCLAKRSSRKALWAITKEGSCLGGPRGLTALSGGIRSSRSQNSETWHPRVTEAGQKQVPSLPEILHFAAARVDGATIYWAHLTPLSHTVHHSGF